MKEIMTEKKVLATICTAGVVFMLLEIPPENVWQRFAAAVCVAIVGFIWSEVNRNA